MKFFAILLLTAIICGCASTNGLKTKASGDSSATVRSGIIVTTTAPDGTVTETCGTTEIPCQERTSVGGAGSQDLWKSVLSGLTVMGTILAAVFL
ncbi:hypothetical protein LCGC14_1045270 [marine sediment metagenome]|uniref:Uncharacterized protein n=1 Tax=marine sediment metagenome TaxID=412755 RepID=A0A0F9MQH3_9ZZZZ